MRKLTLAMMVFLIVGIVAACGGKSGSDELLSLEVDFTVPETTTAGETVELHAFVTYGDEDVTDANVVFEVWEVNDEENSVKIDATNNGDGSYTIDYTFDEPGTYEMYAHTDAHDLHTMPKKQVIVE